MLVTVYDPLRLLPYLFRRYQDRQIDAVLCQAALSAGEAALASYRRRPPGGRRSGRPVRPGAAGDGLAADRRRPATARLFYDHGLVRAYRLDPPPGWSQPRRLPGDLAEALEAQHDLIAHPVGQSLRQGSQTRRDLKRAEAPAIRGFFRALEMALTEHRAALE